MDFGFHSFRIRPLETPSLEQAVNNADKMNKIDDVDQTFQSSQ